MKNDFPIGLRAALYPLYYIDDLTQFRGLTETQLRCLPDDKAPLIEGLEWAVANPNRDFNAVLPDMKHNAAEIVVYAATVLRQLREVENP